MATVADNAPGNAPGDTSGGTRFAPGMQVRARNEDWLVVEVAETEHDGTRLDVRGISALVRDQRAVFFAHDDLDRVTPLRPEDTELEPDPSPECRRSRLFIDALIRKTPLPLSEQRLATVGTHLVDDLAYQREPAKAALRALRPRLLIADAVGLGKTLEVGLLLSELIRRGRGERILVVTPKHILEQFQHELWTRFAIPVVRLDSAGIERIKNDIPAGRNPFSYYKRAIISIDTLRSDRWRSHLMQVTWDAVVIDESHKLISTEDRRPDPGQRHPAQRSAGVLRRAAEPARPDGHPQHQRLRRDAARSPLHPAAQDVPRRLRRDRPQVGHP